MIVAVGTVVRVDVGGVNDGMVVVAGIHDERTTTMSKNAVKDLFFIFTYIYGTVGTLKIGPALY